MLKWINKHRAVIRNTIYLVIIFVLCVSLWKVKNLSDAIGAELERDEFGLAIELNEWKIRFSVASAIGLLVSSLSWFRKK